MTSSTPLMLNMTLLSTPGILDVIDFASIAHHGQVRKYTGGPYIEHSLAVATLLGRFEHDDAMTKAAILHDVLEMTHFTENEITSRFGFDVSELVRDVTDVSKLEDGLRSYRKAKDLQHLALAQPRSKTIKLIDISVNLMEIGTCEMEFAKIYLPEKAAQIGVLEDASDQNAWVFAKEIYEAAVGKLNMAPSPIPALRNDLIDRQR